MRVKIFGERNTGTKFLRATLVHNGVEDLWPGTLAELGEAHRLTRLTPGDGPRSPVRIANEAIADRVFVENFEQTLGWKHTAPDRDRISALAGDTLFLSIAKHPYAWAVSMFRKPHHNLSAGNRKDIETFVSAPWTCVGRDNADAQASSIISLWNIKYRAHLALADVARTVFVRYEDLILVDDALTGMSEEISPGAGPWSLPPVEGEKSRDTSSYREFYAAERWREMLTPRAISLINEQIDLSVVAKLGYRLD